MPQATPTIQIQVRRRWWLGMYLAGVVLFARTTGLEPDWAKVEAAILRGLVVRLAE